MYIIIDILSAEDQENHNKFKHIKHS